MIQNGKAGRCNHMNKMMMMDDKNDLRWHAWVEASGAFPAQPKEYKKVVPDFRLADKWCCLYVRNK